MTERAKILDRAAEVANQVREKEEQAKRAIKDEIEEIARSERERRANTIAKRMMAGIEELIMEKAAQGKRSFTVMVLRKEPLSEGEEDPNSSRVFDFYNVVDNMAFELVLKQCKGLGLCPESTEYDSAAFTPHNLRLEITW